MSRSVVIGGSTYVIPDPGERSWGQNVTDLLVGVGAALGAAGVGAIEVQNISTNLVNAVSGKTYIVETENGVSFQLPPPSANAFFTIKSTTDANNPIQVLRYASESIDGVADDKRLDIPLGSWLFACDGVNWYTIRDDDGYSLSRLDGWQKLIGINPTIDTPGQTAVIRFASRNYIQRIRPGMKIRVVNNSNYRYGFVYESTIATDTVVKFFTPASGQVTAGTIDEVYFSDVVLPYQFPAPTGFTFTPTVNGVTAPTGNIRVWMDGGFIVIALVGIGGTSNATTFSISGLPFTFPGDAASWPVRSATAKDNGVNVSDAYAVPQASSGVINFLRTSGAWTAANQKTIDGIVRIPLVLNW